MRKKKIKNRRSILKKRKLNKVIEPNKAFDPYRDIKSPFARFIFINIFPIFIASIGLWLLIRGMIDIPRAYQSLDWP